MFFLFWDTYVLYYMNIAPKLSTCTVMGISKITSINNKIAQKNNILHHTPVIPEYPSSVTDSVTVFGLRKNHRMRT